MPLPTNPKSQPTPVLGELRSRDDRRMLLVASTGGHLAQLTRLAKAYGADPASTWVTFDSPQSRSLLAEANVLWVDYVQPRDWRSAYRAYRTLEATLDAEEIDCVLSTGAGLALAGFLWARMHRKPAAYIESVSRTNGPSLTGRIVQMLNLATTHTQHASWAGKRWDLVPSVMQQYVRIHQGSAAPRRALKVFVTLGTIRPYRFDSLVDSMKRVLTESDSVTWQLGATPRKDLPGEIVTQSSASDFMRMATEADVVVTHAGVGTLLQLLDAGISPVVVPRRRERGEHVDNHQLQIFELLDESNVGWPIEVDAISREILESAATSRTTLRRIP
jgi:UDP-N-acetylglucosamine transferase subunit ALG13